MSWQVLYKELTPVVDKSYGTGSSGEPGIAVTGRNNLLFLFCGTAPENVAHYTNNAVESAG